jgi:hypothetical protein
MVFLMAYYLGLEHIPAWQNTEIRMTVTIGMFALILLEELAHRDAFSAQARGVLRKRSFQLCPAMRGLSHSRFTTGKQLMKRPIGHG